MVLRMAIEKRGHTVVDVASGNELVAELRGTDFDLVIMDASMPGPTLAERLAWLQDSAPSTPLVVLSGYALEADFAGDTTTRFLTKPIDLELLNEILDGVTAH